MIPVCGSLQNFHWGTFLHVGNKNDLANALVLASSLRQSLTSFEITAFLEWDGHNEADFDIFKERLMAGGFAHIVVLKTRQQAKKDYEGILDILQTLKTTIGEKFKDLERLILLPVDSLVFENCDELAKKLGSSDKNQFEDDISLVNSKCSETIISIKICREVGTDTLDHLYSFEPKTPEKMRISHIDCQSLENADFMEEFPKIVRLIGMEEVKSISQIKSGAVGLIEKSILDYRNELFNATVRPILDRLHESNLGKKQIFWNCEPIAVIGTADSSPKIQKAMRCLLNDAGMTLRDFKCPENLALFTSCTRNNDAEKFLENVKNELSPSFKAANNNYYSDDSTEIILKAIKVLLDFSAHMSLILHMDGKGLTSSMLLKRASDALRQGDKIHSLLGSCTIPNLGKSGDEDSSSDSLEVLNLIEIVRFLNLRGPFVDKPWLDLIQLQANHRRESSVICGIEPLLPGSALVICASDVPSLSKSYPKFGSIMHIGLEPSVQIMAFQSDKEEKLDLLFQNYRKILSQGDYNELKDFQELVYTINTRLLPCCVNDSDGADNCFRAAILAHDYNDACKIISTKTFLKEKLPSENKICFLFTGQGSQYPGMARALYDTCPVFRLSFDKCNNLLRRMHGIDIHSTIWNESSELSRTLYSQTSIFVVEYCLLKVWESWGIKPNCVLGHSLGEFCGAIAASALELEDALKLVAERSRLIDQLPNGKMLVVRGDLEMVHNLVNEFCINNPGAWLDVAAINSKEQTVLSGDTGYVQQFSEFCQNLKIKSIMLEATHAFHSRHMEPMLQSYREKARTCKAKIKSSNECIYISGMDGKIRKDPLDPEYWVRHTREPVRFVDGCKAAFEVGCTTFLEIGPQPILTTLMKSNAGNASSLLNFLPSIRRGGDDWKVMLNSLGKMWTLGEEIDWKSVNRYHNNKNILRNDDSIVKDLLMGLDELP